MKDVIRGLKQDIKALADAGRAYGLRIRDASGPARAELRTLKRSQEGGEARRLLLLYAFLRGVPYRALEARCSEDGSHLRAGLIRDVVDRGRGRGLTVDLSDVEAWMGPISAETTEVPGCAA